jgi:microcompartment protein CcmL/EutN
VNPGIPGFTTVRIRRGLRSDLTLVRTSIGHGTVRTVVSANSNSAGTTVAPGRGRPPEWNNMNSPESIKKTPSRAIGAIELSSIGIGYQVQDALLKAASVELLIARTICSGKYLIIFTGSVSDCESALSAATAEGGEAVIDQVFIPSVHESVFPALGQSVILEAGSTDAIGVVETFSGASIIAAADAAAKAARVRLFRIHVAMALGGKGFCLLTGTVADVRAAVSAGAAEAKSRGLLVSEVVIPSPSKELFADYI